MKATLLNGVKQELEEILYYNDGINYKGEYMNKKILIFCLIFVFTIIITILFKNSYKTINFGKNIINQSADKIKENILNIESYEAKVKIEIISNKNTNTYEAIQK